MFIIEMTRPAITSYLHCGRPVARVHALRFRTKREALALIARSPVAGWDLKAIRA